MHPPPSGPSLSRPLPDLDRLPAAHLSLVLALDGLARPGASAAVASLFRHLADWPAFLALSYARLQPLHQDGRLRAALGRVDARAQGIVRADLVARLDASHAAALREDDRAFVLAALDEFTRNMIGRMVVMGGALRALIPADE